MSAEERRESVIRAALSEFAHGGYRGTSTEAIARRVGVSQPYLFRLFPNKQAIFVAAAERCIEHTRDAFLAAAKGRPPEERLEAMANAYGRLIREDPEKLLMQMQIYAAVATAEAAGDHEFGASLRDRWQSMWDSAHVELGADIEETTTFFAYGMLINTLVSMGFPPTQRNWEGIYEFARAGVGPQSFGAPAAPSP
ncbi:transcriptional regulator, TetR family [Actinacidiphila guanduensis]|uniref:Transcriptional regulator, TetR family n=2 Tax=Actinacidiphila guanduensis TaxID=310781 RepID=A0A1H0IWA0_9ACTN|nr:transcriptional regulator, TetR family [Actinacidiphila guanduensis]